MSTKAVPIVVEPSGEFLGNDGAWSPFLAKVGNPPTKLRLLASTEIPESWVILPLGCTPDDAVNCSDARGGVFDQTESRTWSYKSQDPFALGTESNLGMNQNSDNGLYGFDTMQIGLPGQGNASLDHQLIAGIATKDFFLGNLGLANRKVIFPDSTQEAGLISQLSSNKLIPSLSYGFTAGASYRKSNASLTLGGFDASKFTPNDVTFGFAPNPLRSKVVALQSIFFTDSKSKGTSLMTKPIFSLVDSTVPHIWLPMETCKMFERAFGLSYDSITNLYLVNDTLHSALLKQNPSIIFQLSNSLTGGPAVNITLPYASFDLEVQVGYPSVRKPSRYFPLRQAIDDTQHTLGRTFLQESFLIVNYENRSFSISQSVFSTESPSRIVPIAPAEIPTSTPSSSVPPITKSTSQPSQPSAASHSKSLGTPAIAGIAVSIVVIILVAGAIIFRFRRKRKRRSSPDTPELPSYPLHPQNAAELGAYHGNQFNEKTPGLLTEASDEKIQTEINQTEMKMMDQGNDLGRGSAVELGGSDLLRPELPSPDPFARHELSCSEADIARSELSTPEPGWPAEMPSPEIGSELGGSGTEPSITPSPISSPVSLWLGDGNLSRRPTHMRMDSSEAEGTWARDGIPSQSPRRAPHSRLSSTASTDSQQQPGWFRDRNSPTASSRQRPQPGRFDSTDSESTFPRANITSIRPTHLRAESTDSEGFMISPQRRHSLQHFRPPHRRLDSKDSVETFETRLEMSPPISPYFPPATRLSRDRPVEGLPSIWPSVSEETLISASRASMRSALRSPEPFETGFREEEEQDGSNTSQARILIEEEEIDERGISEEPGSIEAQESDVADRSEPRDSKEEDAKGHTRRITE